MVSSGYDSTRSKALFDTWVKIYEDEYGSKKVALDSVARQQRALGLMDLTRPQSILDLGCGIGELMVALLEHNHQVHGLDFSPEMVRAARRNLRQHGFDPNLVAEGSATDLAFLRSGIIDTVTALGLFPYTPDPEEQQVYQEIRRVLTPGGMLIASYQNSLFDLYTFNRYTLELYEKSFLDFAGTHSQLRGTQIKQALRSLISNPDAPPIRTEQARSNIYVKTHNPLMIRSVLSAAGFELIDLVWYGWHPLPPLLKGEFEELFWEAKAALESGDVRDWRGYIMANAFLVSAKVRK